MPSGLTVAVRDSHAVIGHIHAPERSIAVIPGALATPSGVAVVSSGPSLHGTAQGSHVRTPSTVVIATSPWVRSRPLSYMWFAVVLAPVPQLHRHPM